MQKYFVEMNPVTFNGKRTKQVVILSPEVWNVSDPDVSNSDDELKIPGRANKPNNFEQTNEILLK